MIERLSNLGYMSLIKQSSVGTPLTPTDYIPLYNETLSADGKFEDLQPIYGSKFATQTTIPGQRQFKGDIDCMAEPNTAARIVDMLLTKGNVSGSNPYTFPFTLGLASASYTVDLSLGNIVKRFWGVQASKLAPDWNNNEMRFKLSVSALGSFEGRELSSVTGSGPYTVVLADPGGIFDQNPTKGLVINDLIRFRKASDGTTIDAVVASIVDGVSFTCTANVSSLGSGDAVYLRPATISFNTLQPFMFAKTRVGFGATASAALSATHTPVEQGSGWQIMHDFNDDGGEDRSGSFGPDSLARKTGNISVNIKKICDTPEDEIAYNNLNKSALVWRHFAGPANQYELRVTVNHVKADSPIGNLKSGNLVYVDQKLHTNNDASDGQAFDVKVINALSTI